MWWDRMSNWLIVGPECVRDISVLLNYFELNKSRELLEQTTRFIPLQMPIALQRLPKMARTFSECGACKFMSDKLFEYKDPQDWYIANGEKMQTTII